MDFETQTVLQCGFDLSTTADWVGAAIVIAGVTGRIVWVFFRKLIQNAEEKDAAARAALLINVKTLIEGLEKYIDTRMDQLEKRFESFEQDTKKDFDTLYEITAPVDGLKQRFEDLKKAHDEKTKGGRGHE